MKLKVVGQRAREKYSQYQRREQLFIAAAGVLLVILITYLLIVPAVDFYSDGKKMLIAERENLIWLKNNKAALEQTVRITPGQEDSNAFKKESGKVSLVSEITDMAIKEKIVLKRIEPNANSIRIWIEGTSEQQLLRFLHGIERQTILIDELSVSQGEKSGFISAIVKLGQ